MNMENQEIIKLQDQNEYLRRAYIRMSKGRSMYEAERMRYKTLSAQLEQILRECGDLESEAAGWKRAAEMWEKLASMKPMKGKRNQ